MKFTQYKQDPINGKWQAVRQQQPFTEEEWAEFQKRWDKNEGKKPCFTGVHAFWIAFFVTIYVLLFIRIWGLAW